MLTLAADRAGGIEAGMGDPLAGRKLVILGLARQGKALARFAVACGAQVTISDVRSAAQLQAALQELADLPITYVLGEHSLSLLDGADVLAVSGGVPLETPIVQAARARSIRVTNDAQEFLLRCPAPVIGVTGSAGKSTTTTLTGALVQAGGRRTWVGGNLGNPLIADLGQIGPADVVVQELSSFQLELWQCSPQVAAILNVTPNHLDRHKTMEAYTAAKANIVRWQSRTDIALLPATGLDHLASVTAGRVRRFSIDEPVADGACVQRGWVVVRDGVRETPVCPVDEIPLRGAHNRLNALAAVALADCVGTPTEALREGLRNFRGLPHRLELVGEAVGVRYINDSIATAPERALAALHAFDEPLILLAGGRDKNLDWRTWAEVVPQRVRYVVLFGELAPLLAQHLRAMGERVQIALDLTEAVVAAQAQARPGDVVLLAPGGTSFDAYVDFAARGEHFRALVQALSAKLGEMGRTPVSVEEG